MVRNTMFCANKHDHCLGMPGPSQTYTPNDKMKAGYSQRARPRALALQAGKSALPYDGHCSIDSEGGGPEPERQLYFQIHEAS